MPTGRPGRALPIGLNARLTHEQHEYLEHVAHRHDVTLSGAMRQVLDEAMDRPEWTDSRTGRVLSWRQVQEELSEPPLPEWLHHVPAGGDEGP